jgi:hypothetical protein
MSLQKQIERDAAACGVCKFISEDLRTWHFQSRYDTRIFHTVDLFEWDCSGECSCPHFQIRIRPLLVSRTIRPHSEQARCKHIIRAERILCYRVKKQLSSQQNPNRP